MNILANSPVLFLFSILFITILIYRLYISATSLCDAHNKGDVMLALFCLVHVVLLVLFLFT